MAKNYWGFDVKNIDKKVRPQDDFYHYANGGWLKKTKIPADEARWGSFVLLQYKTQKQLKQIVTTTKHPLVKGIYQSALDMKTRNKLDIGPLAPLRLLVRDIKTKKDLLKVIARLHVLGVTAGWGAMIDQDSKDSSKYLLHLWQGGLGMPERDYYLLDAPEQKRVRAAYIAHMGRLLKLAKFDAHTIKRTQAVVMDIETKLAKAAMKKEDTRDAEKIYHKLSLPQLQKLSPNIDWADYFTRTHAPGIKTLIVGQPDFFKKLSGLLDTISIEEWKIYLEWHVISDVSSLLSNRFVKENFKYSSALSGQKKMRPLWRRALGATGAVGEALGKVYIERHFPASSKRAMDALVSDLFEVYADRIKQLDWMSAPTKRKAILKLRAMTRKIGYPTKWEQYKGLVIDPKDYFGNMLRAEEWHHRKQMSKLRKPIDRGEWHMTPQTVNAYCNFNLNEIVFPAAILQWPFFDPKADMAVNYAAIGSVIGHEMTHGFDDQGSKFDSKGNMRGWWTPGDRKRFMDKSKHFVSQANQQEVEPGVHINGQLTLGENIADMGGVVIAYEAYQRYLKKVGRKIIAGFTPEERFFLGFGQVEQEAVRPEFRKLTALTDPHADNVWRVNGPLSNFEPFYKTFNIKKGDKLYRDPKSRVQIW
jgi:predicted metalloendopeptidase